MKLKYYWYVSEAYKDGILNPSCTVIDPASELDECIANYLVDDGGQSYLATIPWMDECLEKIASIKSGEIEVIDWSRDAWGAELSVSGAKIYSLYDESYFSIMSLDALEKALLTWKEFLQLPPELNLICEIEIGR